MAFIVNLKTYMRVIENWQLDSPRYGHLATMIWVCQHVVETA